MLESPFLIANKFEEKYPLLKNYHAFEMLAKVQIMEAKLFRNISCLVQQRKIDKSCECRKHEIYESKQIRKFGCERSWQKLTKCGM